MSVHEILNKCLQLTHAMLPQSCILCSAASERAPICPACDAALPRLSRARCPVCALPVPDGLTCGACLSHPPRYDGVTAVFAYSHPVDALIHAFKYGGNLTIAGILGSALAESIAAERVDVIVPMPLSPARLRARGFNQAQEIARRVARLTGISLAADLCRKPLDTQPQAALPWKERAKNVRGAFVCDSDLNGVKVAVVDDVMTTGATLNELAKNLRRAGAARVSGWIVARALRQHSGSRIED